MTLKGIDRIIGLAVLLTGVLLSLYMWKLEQVNYDFQALLEMRDMLLWQQGITSIILMLLLLRPANRRYLKAGWYIFPFVFVSMPILLLLKYNEAVVSSPIMGLSRDNFELMLGMIILVVFGVFILSQLVRPLVLLTHKKIKENASTHKQTTTYSLNISPILAWLLLLAGWVGCYWNYTNAEAVINLTDKDHLNNLVQLFVYMVVLLLFTLMVIRPVIYRLNHLTIFPHGYKRVNWGRMLPRDKKLLLVILVMIISMWWINHIGKELEQANFPLVVLSVYVLTSVVYFFNLGSYRYELDEG